MDEETLKKVVLHSVATALAKRVFPVPGGPTISTPSSKKKKNSKKKVVCMYFITSATQIYLN